MFKKGMLCIAAKESPKFFEHSLFVDFVESKCAGLKGLCAFDECAFTEIERVVGFKNAQHRFDVFARVEVECIAIHGFIFVGLHREAIRR